MIALCQVCFFFGLSHPTVKGKRLDYKGNQIEGAACIGIITITTATIISPNKDLTLSPCILEGLWKG